MVRLHPVCRPASRALWILAALLWSGCGVVGAPSDQLPSQLEGVGVREKLGLPVDLKLEFLSDTGRVATLGSTIDKSKPTILTLVYYDCPMLCSLVLNGLTQSLDGLDWTAGKEFNVVTVSIHPNEGPELAAAKRQAQLAAYGRDVEGGWPFLSDFNGNSKRLADQVGWVYRWDERQKQFAHAAAIVLLTPDGRIARYLYGVRHKPRDLRLALTEAGAGRLGGIGERLMMFCYQYDPNSQSYVLFARRFMSVGGALVLCSLIALLFVFWRRERRRISQSLAVG